MPDVSNIGVHLPQVGLASVWATAFSTGRGTLTVYPPFEPT